MALVKGQNTDKDILEIVRFTVERIPQGELIGFGKSSPLFHGGGFRATSAPAIRARIMSAVTATEVIDDQLRRLLARNCECCAAVSALSLDIISDYAKELDCVFGHTQMRLARALDTRECVREKAQTECQHLHVSDVTKDAEDREFALRRLSDALGPLMAVIGSVSAGQTQAVYGGSFQYNKELKELRGELQRLHGVETRLERGQKKLSEVEASLFQAEARAESAEREASDLRRLAETTQAAYDRLNRDVEGRAVAIAEARLAEEFAAWLGGERFLQFKELVPEIFSSHVEESGAGTEHATDLLVRAKAALERQTKADMASGVRDIISKRLDTFRAAYVKCNAAIRNALKPDEGLTNIVLELSNEIVRLEKILSPASDPQVMTNEDALAAAISRADDSQLPDIRHITERLNEIGAISKSSHDRIIGMIIRRYDVCYERRGEPDFETGDLKRPEDVIRMGKAGKLPVILLVDGHNTLFALASRYCRPQDHRGPSSAAREWLIGDIVRIFASSPTCRVIIVFDGPDRTETTPACNVKVVYSGGGDETVQHRADDVLVDEARHFSEADSSCRLLMMTNDNGLASRASRYGVSNIAPTALMQWLD